MVRGYRNFDDVSIVASFKLEAKIALKLYQLTPRVVK